MRSLKIKKNNKDYTVKYTTFKIRCPEVTVFIQPYDVYDRVFNNLGTWVGSKSSWKIGDNNPTEFDFTEHLLYFNVAPIDCSDGIWSNGLWDINLRF